MVKVAKSREQSESSKKIKINNRKIVLISIFN